MDLQGVNPAEVLRRVKAATHALEAMPGEFAAVLGALAAIERDVQTLHADVNALHESMHAVTALLTGQPAPEAPAA